MIIKGRFIVFALLLCGLISTFSSCDKDAVTKPDFVAGQVLFIVHKETSFYNTYKLFDSLELKINEAYDFDYFIETKADSVDIVKAILRTKPYLTNGGRTFSLLYKTDTLYITTNFFNLNSEKANDWFKTVATFGMKENPNRNTFKYGILSVPIGEEQYWVEELKKYSIIKASQLNHIVYSN